MRLSGRPTAGPPFEGRSGRLSSTGGAAAPRELRRGWEVGMALFDAYGRPVDTGLLKEEQAAATFSGIRNIYSIMHPSIGITPEKLNAILRQSELVDLFVPGALRGYGGKRPPLSLGPLNPETDRRSTRHHGK